VANVLPDDSDAYCWGADELERSRDYGAVDIWRGNRMIACHWRTPVPTFVCGIEPDR